METIIIRLIESSVSAALLVIILWVFLPRLIKAIDKQIERNTKEHEALVLMLTELALRMNWHEAKMYGVNPLLPDNENERYTEAIETLNLANTQIHKLREDIRRIFSIHPLQE